MLLSNWVHGYLQVIREYLIVYRAPLLRAVRSCVRGEAIFRISSFTEYKRSGLSIAKTLNLAATLWNSFNSSPVRRSSPSLTSSSGSCHFAVLRSSLIWLALDPPTSSVPGVATPLASVNPKALKARETCCWSGSYSILHCHNVSVLPKKLAVRDCDDPGPRVTTLLSSCASRSKLSACFRSSCRPTMKKSSSCIQNVRLQVIVEEVARRRHASGKSSTLQNLSLMLSPSLGCVQRSVHPLSQFPTHTWLLCLGVLVWQSDADVADRIGAEVGSTHIFDGDQEKVLHSKCVFLARNTGFAKFPAEVLPARSVRPLYGAPPYTPDANGNVELRHFRCSYRQFLSPGQC